MTNANKYKISDEDADKMSDEFAEWHQDNPDVKGYGEALYRFLQAKLKPTLTEDEKVILRNIDNYEKYIGRIELSNDSILYVSRKKDRGSWTPFPYADLFQFIQPRRRI